MATLSPFEQKYQQNIVGLAKANNVDTEAARNMLISNLTQGGQYKGGGVLDFNAAKPDAAAYVEQAKNLGAAMTPATTQAQPDYQGRINSIYDQQRAAQLSQLKAQRDKATGDINLQKQELAPQYQTMRNQTDVGNAAAVQKLREAMASQGLLSSGDNNTEMTNLRINRENQLNNTNLQERQQINQLDRRIADINDPSQEQAMIANIEAARNQAMLNELYQADQRNFRNSQFDYQKQRDQVGDTRWQTEFDYKKNFDQKQFDEDVRRFGVQQAMQLAGITGFYDGKPTFAREQFNSDNSYRNSQLAIAASKAASSGAKSSASAQKASAKEATNAAIAELGKYDNYEQAANDFSNYFQDMKAAGIDTDAVEKAIQVRFRNTERSWIDNPDAGSNLYGQQFKDKYGTDWWKN